MEFFQKDFLQNANLKLNWISTGLSSTLTLGLAPESKFVIQEGHVIIAGRPTATEVHSINLSSSELSSLRMTS